jgi:anti-sigma regulatory factor (Ser/Thr protein kinase)
MPLTATSGQSASCRIDAEPRRVSQVREWARKTLPGWGLTEHADIVELIISELATNAIMHGTGPAEICLSCTPGQLQIEVRDHGTGQPAVCHPGAEDITGRGLALIDALTGSCGGSWGITASTSGHPGKTVYATIPLTHEPATGALTHQHQSTQQQDGAPGPVTTAAAGSCPDLAQPAPHRDTADDPAGGTTPAGRAVLPRRLPPGSRGHRPARPRPLSLTPLTADLATRIIAGLERL